MRKLDMIRTKKRLVKLVQPRTLGQRTLAVLVVLSAVFGTWALVSAQVSRPHASFEAEVGALAGGTAIVSDTSASGGSYVEFGGDVSAKFRTCYPHAFCDAQGQHHILNGVNIRAHRLSSASQTQMQRIRDKGFTVIRIAMLWEQFQPAPGAAGISTARIAELRDAVANARAAGLYVILDPIHGVGQGDCTNGNARVPGWAYVKDTQGTCLGRIGAVRANARTYLQRIASEFTNEPTVVAIDLANEIRPLDYSDNAALLAMYSQLIQEVRQVDPHTILMIKPTTGDKLFSANEIVAGIPDRSNIIYSYHDYYGGYRNANGTPVSNCTPTGYRQSGTICGNLTYENQTGYLYPSVADLEAHLVANLDMLADPRLRLPLFVGEYNIAEGLPNSVQWRKDKTTIFNKHKVGRTVWEFWNRGDDEWQGNHPDSELSATKWGNSNGTVPGAWKDWVDDLF